MPNARRNFLRSLGLAPIGAFVAKAAEATKPKALARSNCILTEAEETWRLLSGSPLKVRHIRMELDFSPGITWTFPLKVQNNFGREAVSDHRLVFARNTELSLRRAYANPRLPGKNEIRLLTSEDSPEIEEPKSPDMTTPFETIVQSHMSALRGRFEADRSKGMGPFRGLPKAVTGGEFGLFATIAIKDQETEYVIGVSPFAVTAKNLIVQVPAATVFDLEAGA